MKSVKQSQPFLRAETGFAVTQSAAIISNFRHENDYSVFKITGYVPNHNRLSSQY